MNHPERKKKITFFKFGKLEILVDGKIFGEIPIAKNGGEMYYVKTNKIIPKGIYQMNLEKLKKIALNRAKLKYGSIGIERLSSVGTTVKIVDKTYQSKEREYTN